MNEETQVKQHLIKNMILNLITFSIIFYILGAIIYGQFGATIYMSANVELEKSITMLARPQRPEQNIILENRDRNPRLVYILRSETGEIFENENVNSIFLNVQFDKNKLNEIYEITVNNKYQYRAINYKLADGNYIQVLINVDAEKAIISSFTVKLIIAFVISIILIILASYFLSKKTLDPIIKSWKKQNQFVQDASHELRTPLAIIQAKQESLLEKPETKIIDNAEDISITLKETQRLNKLIKELMELARNDSKELEITKEKFYLDKELKDLTSLYGEVAENQGKKLILDLNYQEEIFADLNKIKELLIILLDNSFKYTEKDDEITVKTYKKDNKCVLEVIDTGIGISKEAQEHIFERFYREEKSRTREKGGMGLGLSIAYNIVKNHKGIIKIDKNMENGTRIIVKIPCK